MYVKKFIFSKFAGLQAYNQQFTIKWTPSQVFFDSILRPPPMLPPCIDLSPPPPIKFWRAPHVLNTCGKPWGRRWNRGAAIPLQTWPDIYSVSSKPKNLSWKSINQVETKSPFTPFMPENSTAEMESTSSSFIH